MSARGEAAVRFLRMRTYIAEAAAALELVRKARNEVNPALDGELGELDVAFGEADVALQRLERRRKEATTAIFVGVDAGAERLAIQDAG